MVSINSCMDTDKIVLMLADEKRVENKLPVVSSSDLETVLDSL